MPHSTLPTYAACLLCGETASAALMVGTGGQVVCLNCQEQPRHSRHLCTVCARNLPAELHHVASRRAYPTFTTPLCLNCHRILSTRQVDFRRKRGEQPRHPFRSLVIGVLDVVRLFLERSPAADACRQVFCLLGTAAILALGSLCFDALAEVGHALAFIEGHWA
jgi:hypothetical protein